MYQFIKKTKIHILLLMLIEIIFVMLTYILLLYYDNVFGLSDKTISFLLIAILFLFNIFYGINVIRRLEKKSRKNLIDFSAIMSTDITEAYLYGQFGLINYDQFFDIIWVSELFEKRNIHILGENLIDLFPTMKVFFSSLEDKPKEIKLTIEGRYYGVMHLEEENLLLLKDIDEVEELLKTQHDESLIVGNIVLDNLADIVNLGNELMRNDVELNVRKLISDWAKTYNILLRRFKDDAYIIFLREENFARLSHDEFPLLKSVRLATKNLDIPLTISVGIGRGTTDILRLTELSTNAIDVALSRGGDQIVVNNYGSHMEFFGAKSEAKIRKSSVKNRVMAHSLITHISTNNKIVIMPHALADFDAIGSALGLRCLAQSLKKEAYIVWEDKLIENKTRIAFRSSFTKNDITNMIISPSQALELMKDEQVLLVLMDVHRPSLCLSKEVVENAKKIAVIDHHRKSEDAIEGAIFSHIDPSSSSTVELLCDLLKYSTTKVMIPVEYATFMLCGLLLDTNYFTSRTTGKTFEVAGYLKEFGAENDKADDYLKDEYEEVILKNKIMNEAKTPYYGIIVTKVPNDLFVDRTMLAKVGGEAISIKGIKAIFVIGKISETEIGISARSDGSVNVQLIMEKMGGGGHYSSSATQLVSQDILAVENQLMDVLKLYTEELK